MIYPNSGNGYKNEQALADILATCRKKDGETVLSSYTAYTNTVRELYDTQKAVQKLELSEKNAELLFAKHRLYRSPDDVRMTFSDFVDFADDLTDRRKYQGGGKSSFGAFPAAFLNLLFFLQAAFCHRGVKYNARFPALPANKTRSGAHALSVNLWSVSFSRVLSPVFLPVFLPG